MSAAIGLCEELGRSSASCFEQHWECQTPNDTLPDPYTWCPGTVRLLPREHTTPHAKHARLTQGAPGLPQVLLLVQLAEIGGIFGEEVCDEQPLTCWLRLASS